MAKPPSPKVTAHERLLEGLRDIVQVSPEDTDTPLGKDLLALAKKHGVSIMAFIAPQVGVKISPVRQAGASIGLFEEFGLHCALALMQEQYPEMAEKPVWLLVHSPGGEIPSSYLIAKRLRESFIRESFSRVVAFVPHVAYSGGTLIALAADEIVMGEFSRLGPLDPQVYYRRADGTGSMVSALSMKRALDALELELRTTAREEVGYPQQVMAEKLDPVLMEDWNAECLVVATYLQEVLERAGYAQAEINSIQRNLVYTLFPHDYVVHRDRAREFGLKCADPNSAHVEHLELMQEWLVKYMLQPEFRHYIRFVTPAMEDPDAAEDKGARASAKRPSVPSGPVGEGAESAASGSDGARASPAVAGSAD